MSLTPLLNDVGRKLADIVAEKFGDENVSFWNNLFTVEDKIPKKGVEDESWFASSMSFII